MPTFRQLVDDIISGQQGGVRTISSKFQSLRIEDIIHQARADAIGMMYNASKRVHPVWMQQHIPPFSQDLQEDPCMVRFVVPAPIAMNSTQDGFMYIGTLDKNCAYPRLLSRAEVAMYNKHRNTKNEIKVLYSDGYLEVYGNTMLKEIRLDGIFQRPTEIPTFNEDMDEYPIDAHGISVMKELIYKPQFMREAPTPGNLKQDNKDATALPAKP